MADLVGQDGADEVPQLERRQEWVRFNCSLSLLSATQGMETRTVADLLSGAKAVRPHVGRAADIRITVTLGAVSLPLTHAPGPSHGCQSTITPAVSRSALATSVDRSRSAGSIGPVM